MNHKERPIANIETQGFLSEEISKWVQGFRSKHEKFFSLVSDTNALCQKTMFELDAHSRHGQEVLVASLYIRALGTFQAAILLAEKGMIPQANMLARSLLEVIFTLSAICKNKELVNIYVNEDKKLRLRFLNKLRKFHGGEFPEDVNPEEIKQLEEELHTDIQKDGIKVRRTDEWAEDAGLTSWYLTVYPILSETVHAKARNLERHFIIDNDGEIIGFNWGPDDTGIEDVLMLLVEGILIALKNTSDFFKAQRDEAIEKLRERLHVVVGERAPSDA